MTLKCFRCLPSFPLIVALFATILTGCAHDRQREGMTLIEQGQYEEGLAILDQTVVDSPNDSRTRMTRTVQYKQVTAQMLARADRLRANRDYPAAEEAYKRVLGIEPANSRALEALRQLEQMRTIDERNREGRLALRRGDLDGAERQVTSSLELDPLHDDTLALKREIEDLRARTASPFPQLRSKFSKPVSLEFRDANLKMIFEVLARTAEINFIFDKEVKPDLKATIFVKQVAVEDAVELLLMQNQLLKKVINSNTVVIYPDTPQKLKEFQDLTLRTFYLANFDVKAALNLIKTMLKTRDVFIDERLNTLTMRDTVDSVRLAEKLLAAQDQPDPEVVLEIEVLEVSRQRILDLGINWPTSFTALNPSGGSISLLSQLRGVVGSPSRVGINPGVSASIKANDTNVNTLANPMMRVRNKEKARIHIGDRIPVVSATASPSTQGPVFTETVSYLDVGLKIEVEPTIYLNDDVGIKIQLEVSNPSPPERTDNGTILYRVSTRNASTGLRLKDGETQVLAGLLRNDLTSAAPNRIPGLGDMPGVGRLFGITTDTVSNTELVLAITPRIVRNLSYMSPHEMEFPSGTDATLRVRPVTLRGGEESGSPTQADAGGRVGVLAVAGTAARPSEAPAAAVEAAVAAPAVAAPTPLTMAWTGPAALKAGEEAEFLLQVTAEQPLRSANMQIAWDPAALKTVEVIEGDLLKQDGDRTTFSPRLDEVSGRMFLTTARSGEQGITGAGSLLRLRVIALAAQDESTPLRVLSLTAVGERNRLLITPPPPPVQLTITR